MLFACWSVKGGVGTTVVAAALALLLAGRSPAGAVLADLAGDCPAALGLSDPPPPSPGLGGWLAAGPEVPADALRRLELPAAPGLALLPRGERPPAPTWSPAPGGAVGGRVADRAHLLAGILDRAPRPAVADCGRVATAPGPAAEVVAQARHSLLVTRPCFLALRRAAGAPLRPTGVIVVREAGRVLSAGDVEQAVGAPVVAALDLDPAVARAVDAGLLASRLPRSLARPLAKVLPDVT